VTVGLPRCPSGCSPGVAVVVGEPCERICTRELERRQAWVAQELHEFGFSQAFDYSATAINVCWDSEPASVFDFTY
jgi:hypothetical protein